MATKLTKPVCRETAKVIQHRNIIVTVAPCGSQSEALIGLRLKGTRQELIAPVSALYQTMALWHANKIRSAKAAARKSGIAWSVARKQFNKENTI